MVSSVRRALVVCERVLRQVCCVAPLCAGSLVAAQAQGTAPQAPSAFTGLWKADLPRRGGSRVQFELSLDPVGDSIRGKLTELTDERPGESVFLSGTSDGARLRLGDRQDGVLLAGRLQGDALAIRLRRARTGRGFGAPFASAQPEAEVDVLFRRIPVR